MSRLSRLSQRGLYRSRNGLISGVCRGIAEYFDFSVTWVRVFVVTLFLATGLWPVGVLYLVAAVMMKLEPVIAIQSEDEREFYDSYATSSHRAAQRLKKRYDNLERRIQRMEHVVTSKEFTWEDRL